MMTTVHSSGDCLLVAIDVAKRAHDVLVRWPSGRSQAFRVANQRRDFEGLTDFLQDQELPVRVALEAIQSLGGNGYINEYPTGRLLRDAKLYDIGAGTNEIRRMLIGREIFNEGNT